MSGVKFRLSVMMFLQYAIWGAWLPILWPFLEGYRGLTSDQITNIFAVGALGAFVAPLVAGQIADRYFSTERFLGISHLVGAAVIWKLAAVESYGAFLAFSLIYSIIYTPTLSLTNSLCFHHVDRDRDFGKIRLWGTLGWIVVGIQVGHLLAQRHTPDAAEAAHTLAAQMDSTERQRLLRESQVTLVDRTVLVGTVERQDAQELLLLPDGAAEPRVVPARDVASVVPLYEAMAAPDRGADLRRALETLEQSPDAAARAEATRALEAPDLYQRGTLRGPIIAAQNAGRADAFRISALLGLVLGLFCFFLPRTPPQRGEHRFATAAVLEEVRHNPLLTLFLLAVPVSCIHQFYFVHTASFLTELDFDTSSVDWLFGVGGGGLMTLGQVCEILVLALIPLVARRVSRKTFLGVGLLAYALRMFLFAHVGKIHDVAGISPTVTVLSGVALHGLCFGCFIFVSFMIVDEETSKDARASAQSLYNLVIVGIGIIVGSKIAGLVKDWATPTGITNYTRLFSVPMWASLACLAVLLAFYPRSAPRS